VSREIRGKWRLREIDYGGQQKGLLVSVSTKIALEQDVLLLVFASRWGENGLWPVQMHNLKGREALWVLTTRENTKTVGLFKKKGQKKYVSGQGRQATS